VCSMGIELWLQRRAMRRFPELHSTVLPGCVHKPGYLMTDVMLTSWNKNTAANMIPCTLQYIMYKWQWPPLTMKLLPKVSEK
jgi:hypothetical protein